MGKGGPSFKTLDESIADSARHDAWFRVSTALIGVGSLLAIAAKTIYGREFRLDDPLVGPVLRPFSVLYLASFMHVFYKMVRIRLSKGTRILCITFGIAMMIFLTGLLVVQPVLQSIKK